MKKILYSFMVIILLLFLTQYDNPPKRDFFIPSNMPQNTKIENVEIALALGGGGSRGMAHIGVIEVLEENHIPIDMIVGVSAGSAIGALYADNKDIKKVKDLLFTARKEDLLEFSLWQCLLILTSPTAFYKGEVYENFIFDNLRAKEFSELKIPLVVVAADIDTGDKLIINNGSIAPAIRASSAVPPFLPPTKLYNRTLIDGGIIEPVPVMTARSFNPKLVIAVDINSGPPKESANNLLKLVYKAFWFSYYELSRIQAKMADIDIHADYSKYGYFDDNNKEEIYQLGRNSALKMLPLIKEKMSQMNIKSSP